MKKKYTAVGSFLASYICVILFKAIRKPELSLLRRLVKKV